MLFFSLSFCLDADYSFEFLLLIGWDIHVSTCCCWWWCCSFRAFACISGWLNFQFDEITLRCFLCNQPRNAHSIFYAFNNQTMCNFNIFKPRDKQRKKQRNRETKSLATNEHSRVTIFHHLDKYLILLAHILWLADKLWNLYLLFVCM